MSERQEKELIDLKTDFKKYPDDFRGDYRSLPFLSTIAKSINSFS
jgi:hypothetical protein